MDNATRQSILISNGNKYWIFSSADINKIPQGLDILISPPTSTPTPVLPTPTPTPIVTLTPPDSETIVLNWHLTGNDGSAEEGIAIPQGTLNDKESITLVYNLHGLCLLGNDASAIAFEQGEWKYTSLSNYGQNCKDGEQTTTIVLSDFAGLDKNADIGNFITRFWYSGSFAVDIISVKFNAEPVSNSNTVQLNWHLTGNNGASEAYQDVDENILQGKQSITIIYNLNGFCAGGGDESAIIFDQNNDWRFVSLSNYGENCKDGEQTVTIPLSDFPNLDTNAPLTGSFHTRFWYSGPFMVDIISVTWN